MPNAPHSPRSAGESDAADITARILLETQSVLFRPDDPFTFTSGRLSPVYIDCRRLISFPRARKRLMDLGAELIERHCGFEGLDAIAGGETAGIPFAAWIADRLSLPMLYVRKQPKGFGRNAQIEGELKDEARILLVEDLASEGTSKLNFVRAIRQAGGVIDHAFVIFNYGIFPQIETSLAAEGITLLALATWWDVAQTAERLGRFAPGQYDAVRSFLEDPEAWSKARATARLVSPGSETQLNGTAPTGLALEADATAAEQVFRLIGVRVLIHIEVKVDVGMADEEESLAADAVDHLLDLPLELRPEGVRGSEAGTDAHVHDRGVVRLRRGVLAGHPNQPVWIPPASSYHRVSPIELCDGVGRGIPVPDRSRRNGPGGRSQSGAWESRAPGGSGRCAGCAGR